MLNTPFVFSPTRARNWCVAGLALCGVLLAGCQADFAVDLQNSTPQPLFAQIMTKSNSGNSATLGASRRLGPGDRAMVGPVRTNEKAGAYLVLDTLPNTTRPVTVDLRPGTSFLIVKQDTPDNSSPMRVEEKR